MGRLWTLELMMNDQHTATIRPTGKLSTGEAPVNTDQWLGTFFHFQSLMKLGNSLALRF
jgi:hypothetical protein